MRSYSAGNFGVWSTVREALKLLSRPAWLTARTTAWHAAPCGRPVHVPTGMLTLRLSPSAWPFQDLTGTCYASACFQKGSGLCFL